MKKTSIFASSACPWLKCGNASGKRKKGKTKHFMDKNHRRRPLERKREMTEQVIVNAIRSGTLFGMVEYDIDVPEHLRDYFAEMQPIFKKTFVTRSDIGSFMRDYAETHNRSAYSWGVITENVPSSPLPCWCGIWNRDYS